MKRRLYYLLPDTPHAQSLSRELVDLAIPRLNVQALAESRLEMNKEVKTRMTTEPDRDDVLEWWLWRVNLLMFFLALIAFVGVLVFLPWPAVIIPLLVMVACLLVGVSFSLRMPNVHWREFTPAVHHGEILLMVEVPSGELKRVDEYVHRRHPEAVTGGVGWAA